MKISRRNVMNSAATMMAAAPFAVAPTSVEAAAPDFGALPTAQELWDDLLFLISLGSRNTGFPGHVKFVDFLADRLKACPKMQVFRDTYTLPRWEAQNYAL